MPMKLSIMLHGFILELKLGVAQPTKFSAEAAI